jgi:hypothetical protein
VPVAKSNTDWANQTTPGDNSSESVMEDILETSQRFNHREVGNTTDNAGLQDALQNMQMATQSAAVTT